MKLLRLLITCSCFQSLFISNVIWAKDVEQESIQELYNLSLDELLNVETEIKANVGSRSEAIDLLKAKVPIDVITSEQIKRTGYTELSKVLQRFIPGFNFPRTSLADGSDHIRPFTLRGMGADQVLVLVNGKRLHNTSLLHVNGTIGRGSTSVDLNTLPLSSIERVEVLRDSAAAQYGSDAIAGIINIILKSGGEERNISTTIGQRYAGDGVVYQTDAHYGIRLPYDGFIDISAEFRDRNPTNRSPVNNFHPRGEGDTQDYLFALNAEVVLSEAIVAYLHGSINYRESERNAFFRQADSTANVRAIYPEGFLPKIAPDILDYSATSGIKGETLFGLKWDISHTIGGNRIDYQVHNSLNASLGTASPTSFQAGGLGFRQHTTNLDFLKSFDVGLYQPLKVGAGLEWRYETFNIRAGEENSYRHGGNPVLDGDNKGKGTASGSQGFPGFQRAKQEGRHNFSVYIDLDTKLAKQWLLGLAGRYEYFTDFGSSINGKISLGYRPFNNLLLRSSASTGFRAPSLQQSFFDSDTSVHLDNVIKSGSTLSVNHPTAQALGATELKAETSQHFTAGIVYEPNSNFSLSGDYFYTRINDRIIFSSNIKLGISPEVDAILDAGNFTVARFFTNAIDTQTQGFDLRAHYKIELPPQWGKLNLTGLYHYNKTKILGAIQAPDILGTNTGNVIFEQKEQDRITSGQPNSNFILMTHYQHNGLDINLKFIRAGSFFDRYHLGHQWLTDLDISYQFYKKFTFAIGGHNILDTYPQKKGSGFPQHSPYGFNGGFYYFRLSADF